MIELKNISKKYLSKKSAPVDAIKNVSLALPEKGMVFILGKSGSGKSTLLNLIGGLDKADSGEIVYNGKSFASFHDKDYDNYRNNSVGFVFQEFNLIDKFNVVQNIDIATKMQGDKDALDKITNALKIVGLSGYEKRQIAELSGGQKQRIAIARALVKESKIILADEPTGNLDSETSAEIFDLLKDISHVKLVVVVSHDKENAQKYSDRTIEIKDGEINSDIAKDSISEALTNDTPCYKSEDSNAILSVSEALTNDTPCYKSENSNTILSVSEALTNDKLCYKSEDIRNAKLSNMYALKMAIHNLFSKKLRSIFAILIATLSVALVCFAQIQYSFDAEKSIVYTAKHANQNFLTMQRFALKRTNDDLYFFRNSVNQASYQELDRQNFDYIKVYNGNKFVIDNANKIEEMGFELIDSFLPIDDLGRYYTDYSIDKLISAGGEVDYDGEFSYDKVVGKQIKTTISDISGSHSFLNDKILGVVYTGYKSFVDESMSPLKELSKEQAKDESVVKAYNFFLQNKDNTFLSHNKLFKSEHFVVKVDNGYNSFAGVDYWKQLGTSYSFEFKSGNNIARLLPENLIEVREFDYFRPILTKNGYQNFGSDKITSGDIIISLDIYNSLFDNEIEPCTEKNRPANYDPRLPSTYYLADYLPKHMGEKIDFSLLQTDLGEKYLELNGKTIVGIVVNELSTSVRAKGERDYLAYVATGEVTNNVSERYYYDSKNDKILLKIDDKNSGVALLKTLKNDYSMMTNGVNSFGTAFYSMQDRKDKDSGIFLAIALISLAITVLMIINIISFGINARKKEIGILRALGSSGSGVTKIFIFESLILGVIISILSVLATIFAVFMLNFTISAQLLMPGAIFYMTNFLTYCIIFGVSIGLILLVSYLPLIKISRMKPVDAIKS